MIIFSLIILLLYSVVFIVFRFSWKNLKHNFSSLDVSTSIIIAMRNEEENILNLLKDISAQNYPKRNIHKDNHCNPEQVKIIEAYSNPHHSHKFDYDPRWDALKKLKEN